MADPDFSIPSRQKTDILFETQKALGNGESFADGPKRVTGYAQVTVLAISDQAFSITVEEAVFVNEQGIGNFTVTGTLNSAVVGSQHVVNTRIQPTGNYMKMTVVAAGDQSFLDFMARGLPVS